MAVQVKLSGVKQLSNTSLTSIVEFTNFNVNLIASAVQDFLRSINYVEGQDEVSVEIASIDSDVVQIKQKLSVLGTQLNTSGTYDEVIRLEPSGSVISKNVLANDVLQGLRVRLKVFGQVPPVGVPGEIIYIQEQPGYEEGFYGYLVSRGWVCLSCGDSNGGPGGNCCCNKENIIYTNAGNTTGNGALITNDLSLGLVPALGTGFMFFVNGMQIEVGDGTKNAPVYLSDDNGTSALNFYQASPNSKFYWNASYGGFDLDTTDRITMRYIAIDPTCGTGTTTTTTTLAPISTTTTTAGLSTTTTTVFVTSTTIPCAADTIVYVTDPLSPTTRVTFTGTPVGPYQVQFTDAYGTLHFVTSLGNIIMPWVFDLSNPYYSSIPTVNGVYQFIDVATGCTYTKYVGVNPPTSTTTTTAGTTTTTTTTSTTTTTAGTTTTTSTTAATTTSTTAATTTSTSTTTSSTTTSTSTTTDGTTTTTTTLAVQSTDPTLEIWYDATWDQAFAAGTINNSYLSQWNDRSSTSHDANSNGNTGVRPRYRTAVQCGLPSVYFDGDNDLFTINPLTAIANKPGTSLILAGRADVINGDAVITMMSNPGGDPIYDMYFGIESGRWAFGSANGTAIAIGAPADLDFHIFEFYYDGTATQPGGTFEFYIDGVLRQISYTQPAGPNTDPTSSYLYVGTDVTGARDFNGFIGELIMYSRTISESEKHQVRNYLLDKWFCEDVLTTTTTTLAEISTTSTTANLNTTTTTMPDGLQIRVSTDFSYGTQLPVTVWYAFNPSFNSTQPYPQGLTWTQLGTQVSAAICNSYTHVGWIMNPPVGYIYLQVRSADGTQLYNTSGANLGSACASSSNSYFTHAYLYGSGSLQGVFFHMRILNQAPVDGPATTTTSTTTTTELPPTTEVTTTTTTMDLNGTFDTTTTSTTTTTELPPTSTTSTTQALFTTTTTSIDCDLSNCFEITLLIGDQPAVIQYTDCAGVISQINANPSETISFCYCDAGGWGALEGDPSVIEGPIPCPTGEPANTTTTTAATTTSTSTSTSTTTSSTTTTTAATTTTTTAAVYSTDPARIQSYSFDGSCPCDFSAYFTFDSQAHSMAGVSGDHLCQAVLIKSTLFATLPSGTIVKVGAYDSINQIWKYRNVQTNGTDAGQFISSCATCTCVTPTTCETTCEYIEVTVLSNDTEYGQNPPTIPTATIHYIGCDGPQTYSSQAGSSFNICVCVTQNNIIAPNGATFTTSSLGPCPTTTTTAAPTTTTTSTSTTTSSTTTTTEPCACTSYTISNIGPGDDTIDYTDCDTGISSTIRPGDIGVGAWTDVQSITICSQTQPTFGFLATVTPNGPCCGAPQQITYVLNPTTTTTTVAPTTTTTTTSTTTTTIDETTTTTTTLSSQPCECTTWEITNNVSGNWSESIEITNCNTGVEEIIVPGTITFGQTIYVCSCTEPVALGGLTITAYSLGCNPPATTTTVATTTTTTTVAPTTTTTTLPEPGPEGCCTVTITAEDLAASQYETVILEIIDGEGQPQSIAYQNAGTYTVCVSTLTAFYIYDGVGGDQPPVNSSTIVASGVPCTTAEDCSSNPEQTTTTTSNSVNITLFARQENIPSDLDFHYSTNGGITWNITGNPFTEAGECTQVVTLSLPQGSDLVVRIGSSTDVNVSYPSVRDTTICPNFDPGNAICEWPISTIASRSFYFTVDVQNSNPCQ
jgi:hypothetical protein